MFNRTRTFTLSRELKIKRASRRVGHTIKVKDIKIKARILIGHFLTARERERKREKWKDKINIKFGGRGK